MVEISVIPKALSKQASPAALLPTKLFFCSPKRLGKSLLEWDSELGVDGDFFLLIEFYVDLIRQIDKITECFGSFSNRCTPKKCAVTKS